MQFFYYSAGEPVCGRKPHKKLVVNPWSADALGGSVVKSVGLNRGAWSLMKPGVISMNDNQFHSNQHSPFTFPRSCGTLFQRVRRQRSPFPCLSPQFKH